MEKLKILNGAMAGREVALTENRVRVGSDEACEIWLAEPGVSGVHVVLTKAAEGWFAKDSGGSFGTLLNGVDLQQSALKMGDTLTLGWIRLRLLQENKPGSDAGSSRGAGLPGVEEEVRDTLSVNSPSGGAAKEEQSAQDSTQLAGLDQMTHIYREEIKRLEKLQEEQALAIDALKTEKSKALEALALKEDELSQTMTEFALLRDENEQLETRNAILTSDLAQLASPSPPSQVSSPAPSSELALQEQVESLQSTLNLYYEENEQFQTENERLKLQLSAYEEAAEANEFLLEERDKLQDMVKVIQKENDHLKSKVREFWQILHRHDLLP